MFGSYPGKIVIDDDADIKVDPTPSFKIVVQDEVFVDGGGSKNIAVSATPATPQFFTAAPPSNEIWYIFGLTFYIAAAGGLVHDKFGNGLTLTNGLELEGQIDNNPVNTFFELFRNSDIATHFMQGGNTGSNNSFSGIIDIRPLAVTLTGSTGDFLRWRVQDDLTTALFIASTLRIWRKI